MERGRGDRGEGPSFAGIIVEDCDFQLSRLRAMTLEWPGF